MATIALVDDDKNILASVTMLLEQEGYHVRSYTDGASALTALTANPPDMAILDIKMPRMDGMELLRRLRQANEIPVIFLTSKDEEIDELMGLNAGADDYIRKPFSQRLLLERVKAVLRRAEGRKGAQPTAAETKQSDVCSCLSRRFQLDAMKPPGGKQRTLFLAGDDSDRAIDFSQGAILQPIQPHFKPHQFGIANLAHDFTRARSVLLPHQRVHLRCTPLDATGLAFDDRFPSLGCFLMWHEQKILYIMKYY